MEKFLNSNSWQMRLARTIVQGILAVIIANIDFLVGTHFDGQIKAMIVALVMAVLSPIMAQLKKEDEANG